MAKMVLLSSLGRKDRQVVGGHRQKAHRTNRAVIHCSGLGSLLLGSMTLGAPTTSHAATTSRFPFRPYFFSRISSLFAEANDDLDRTLELVDDGYRLAEYRTAASDPRYHIVPPVWTSLTANPNHKAPLLVERRAGHKKGGRQHKRKKSNGEYATSSRNCSPCGRLELPARPARGDAGPVAGAIARRRRGRLKTWGGSRFATGGSVFLAMVAAETLFFFFFFFLLS